jgi:Phosphoinositide phospholipase C, Ca2+-dependent
VPYRHSDPIASINNYNYAPLPGDLYSGKTSQDLDSCLGDIATWLSVHPTANPIMVKLELKAGFDQTIGMGPAELDSYINAHIGAYVYKPVDLLTKPDGTQYPTLDAAAKADNWPTRQQLQGKVIIEAIPGTFEMANPFDHLWTDTEYADYLGKLESSGQIANAEIFPSVLGAQTGDPRTRYPAAIQLWFVVLRRRRGDVRRGREHGVVQRQPLPRDRHRRGGCAADPLRHRPVPRRRAGPRRRARRRLRLLGLHGLERLAGQRRAARDPSPQLIRAGSRLSLRPAPSRARAGVLKGPR